MKSCSIMKGLGVVLFAALLQSTSMRADDGPQTEVNNLAKATADYEWYGGYDNYGEPLDRYWGWWTWEGAGYDFSGPSFTGYGHEDAPPSAYTDHYDSLIGDGWSYC